jgi:hypothetical protein
MKGNFDVLYGVQMHINGRYHKSQQLQIMFRWWMSTCVVAVQMTFFMSISSFLQRGKKCERRL